MDSAIQNEGDAISQVHDVHDSESLRKKITGTRDTTWDDRVGRLCRGIENIYRGVSPS